MQDWLPALSTSGLLAGALWLARNLIANRLAKTVEHDFNVRLEEVRAELRRSEESLKAELRAKELQLNALQGGALAAMLSRQQAIDKRRLEAVDQIWQNVVDLGPARAITMFLAPLKSEAVAAEARSNPKARDYFGSIGGDFDLKTLNLASAQKARPFVTPTVWATFIAYSTVCMHGPLRRIAIKGGLPDKEVMDTAAIDRLILAALPHYEQYLAEHGSLAYFRVFEALEEKLLSDINEMLKGVDADADAVARSATILDLANRVAQPLTQA